jgi:hypothetical protein
MRFLTDFKSITKLLETMYRVLCKTLKRTLKMYFHFQRLLQLFTNFKFRDNKRANCFEMATVFVD